MHTAQAWANAPRRTRSLPLRLMPQRLAVAVVNRHCLGASSPTRFHVDVSLLPVGRGGVRDPLKQTNCTTGQPNRTDLGCRRLPEETFTIRAWSRQTPVARVAAPVCCSDWGGATNSRCSTRATQRMHRQHLPVLYEDNNDHKHQTQSNDDEMKSLPKVVDTKPRDPCFRCFLSFL